MHMLRKNKKDLSIATGQLLLALNFIHHTKFKRSTHPPNTNQNGVINAMPQANFFSPSIKKPRFHIPIEVTSDILAYFKKKTTVCIQIS